VAARLERSGHTPHAGHNLYVIGRGLGLAIAQEAALKLKETCALHAEAVSAAELRHGPMALVRAGFPLLIFSTSPPAVAQLGRPARAPVRSRRC